MILSLFNRFGKECPALLRLLCRTLIYNADQPSYPLQLNTLIISVLKNLSFFCCIPYRSLLFLFFTVAIHLADDYYVYPLEPFRRWYRSPSSTCIPRYWLINGSVINGVINMLHLLKSLLFLPIRWVSSISNLLFYRYPICECWGLWWICISSWSEFQSWFEYKRRNKKYLFLLSRCL